MGKLVRVVLVGAALLALTGGSAVAGKGHAPSNGTSAFIRVNQVGYPAGARKQAFVMASAALSGATYAVSNGTTNVATGSLGSSVGSWSTAYPDVYSIDFSNVTANGTYHITVSGPVSVASPTFTINTGPTVYGGALKNALSFFQNERDGSKFIASPIRTAAGHLTDQNAMTYTTPSANSSGRFSGDLSSLGVHIDASGGWWDAGDYLKFLETTSYTDGVLLSGVRDFPAQMGTGSGADFTAEAKFGADFLLRMWDDSTKTLYYQ
ncbi:MAG TPA: glycoside hydrolase family 9 protein, partial [Gaiellales bacterium]|nr:glycoside hydrolase family 9 protein [Gaiellales bacterium]